MKSTKDLLHLLIDIETFQNPNFSGVGLILYRSNTNSLPISSLIAIDSSPFLPIVKYDELLSFLINASDPINPFHDGFHLLNENLQLTHVSQYIAPRIVPKINFINNFGSRYRTAIYSSFLPDIIAVGVLSKNYGPTVFINGRRITI